MMTRLTKKTKKNKKNLKFKKNYNADSSIIHKQTATKTKKHITIGIEDDVTHLSIPYGQILSSGDTMKQCIFWGFGSDGTVGANKNAVKIISQMNTPFMYVQAYFAYDALKAGGITTSHLIFSRQKFERPYEILSGATYIAIHKSEYVTNPNLVGTFRLLDPLQEGGVVVINAKMPTTSQFEKLVSADMRYVLHKKKAQIYVIDAHSVAQASGLERQLINNIMQSVFLHLTSIISPIDLAIEMLVNIMKSAYRKKGPTVVQNNCDAVYAAKKHLYKIETRPSWGLKPEIPEIPEEVKEKPEKTPSSLHIYEGVNSDHKYNTRMVQIGLGDKLPVSSFRPDGVWELGQSSMARRAIASAIPIVDMNKCTQCNKCASICPHASIRPYLVDPKDLRAAPMSFSTKSAIGGAEVAGLAMRLQVSPYDCTGCEVCVNACPEGALEMIDRTSPQYDEEVKNYDYVEEFDLDGKYADRFDKYTLKGSQFQQPLLEFSGACAGCGETPYLKLLTQMFGKRMVIANASGCSSVFGGTHGFVPETVEKKTKLGPAWGSSLFEDNAEYGLGIATVIPQRRESLKQVIQSSLQVPGGLIGSLRKYLQLWLDNAEDAERAEEYGLKACELLRITVAKSSGSRKGAHQSREEVINMLKTLEITPTEERKTLSIEMGEEIMSPFELLAIFENSFVKPSMWIVGGDGWAADIGYSGIDHLMRTCESNQNINILILDTEVYSNTGGQASKSTQLSALVKFRSQGNRFAKKYMWQVALNNYPFSYVASIAMGANYTQAVRALQEAEAFPGQSIIVCYCPCIEHRVVTGLTRMAQDQESAVQCGYWPLFRRHPAEGLTLDKKDIEVDKLTEFLDAQNRYLQLKRDYPKTAELTRADLHKIILENNKLLRTIASQPATLDENLIDNQINDQIDNQISVKINNDVPSPSIIHNASIMNDSSNSSPQNGKIVRSYMEEPSVVPVLDHRLLPNLVVPDWTDNNNNWIDNTNSYSTFTSTPRNSGDTYGDSLEYSESEEGTENVRGTPKITNLTPKLTKLRIYYVSDGGNTRTLAENFFRYIKRHKHVEASVAALSDMDGQLVDGDSMVLMISTCGDGEIPDNGKTAIERIQNNVDVLPTNIRFCVFGTGSRSYPQFCKAASVAYEVLKKANKWTEFLDTVLADESEEPIEVFYEGWKTDVSKKLGLNETIAVLPPVVEIEYPRTTPDDVGISNDIQPAGSQKVIIRSNKRITPAYYSRDVRHIVLDVSRVDLPFKLGDAIGLYPYNKKDEILQLFGIGYADETRPIFEHLIGLLNTTIILRNTPDTCRHIAEACGKRITFLQLLENSLDIFGEPTASFLTGLKEQKVNFDDKILQTTKLTIAEVIARTSSATGCYWQPTIYQLIEILPPLKPRLYSIANSEITGTETIELCVVIHKFEASNLEDGESVSQTRTGTCCRFLEANPVLVNAFIHKGTFADVDNYKTSKIMIGLGTGIAPIRAFAQYHAHFHAQGENIGELMTFYGTRRKKEEFLFENEWKQWERTNVLASFSAAFSHDAYSHDYEPNKDDKLCFVTSKIPEHATYLARQIAHGSRIYYCGPKGAPLEGIKNSITDAIYQKLGLSFVECRKLIEKKCSVEAY